MLALAGKSRTDGDLKPAFVIVARVAFSDKILEEVVSVLLTNNAASGMTIPTSNSFATQLWEAQLLEGSKIRNPILVQSLCR